MSLRCGLFARLRGPTSAVVRRVPSVVRRLRDGFPRGSGHEAARTSRRASLPCDRCPVDPLRARAPGGVRGRRRPLVRACLLAQARHVRALLRGDTDRGHLGHVVSAHRGPAAHRAARRVRRRLRRGGRRHHPSGMAPGAVAPRHGDAFRHGGIHDARGGRRRPRGAAHRVRGDVLPAPADGSYGHGARGAFRVRDHARCAGLGRRDDRARGRPCPDRSPGGGVPLDGPAQAAAARGSLHAVLVLPALAWLLSRTSWSETVRLRVVEVAVGCYVVAVAGAGVWAVLTY